MDRSTKRLKTYKIPEQPMWRLYKAACVAYAEVGNPFQGIFLERRERRDIRIIRFSPGVQEIHDA